MVQQDFSKALEERVEYIENIIKNKLPDTMGHFAGFQRTVADAMNYSVLVGGKRLRPMMLLESFRCFSGASIEDSLPDHVAAAMAAIEFIHTYSLVHDDLPAMDNDEYRRGKPTTWKKFGDGMGVLAGDGLLNYAFEILGEATKKLLEADNVNIDNVRRSIEATSILAQKAGISGMIGGQCADLEAEGKTGEITSENLIFIHEHKTACMIEAALMMGAVLGGATKAELELMKKIGSNVGIAFQIRDDILDVISTTEELGKPVGSDEINEKVTYVTLNGLDKSKEAVERLSREAEELLERLPGKHDFLDELIKSLIDRRK